MFRRLAAVARRTSARATGLRHDRRGGVATTFALLLVPLVAVAGFGIDYMRLMGARDKLQVAIDQAVLAAAKAMTTKTDAELTALVAGWVAAAGLDTSYTITGTSVSRTSQQVTANATVAVPTVFSRVIGLNQMSTTTASTATGSNEVFMNVYLLLDNSASMGLAATAAAQKTMNNIAGCVFACHDPEGTYYYKGKTYDTTNDVAEAAGVTLRRDVMNSAAKKVIAMIDSADPKHERIKVGVYYFNKGLSTAQDLTYTTSSATAALSGSYSELGVDGTYFDTSLAAMTTKVGKAGDGSTASSPLKLVLLVTDGVQSLRSWVLTSASTQRKVGPFNPTYCSPLKTNGVSLGVLYTEYLAINGDWGYDATVGAAMSNSAWGGTLKSGVSSSTERRDYLPYALTDCASPGFFMSANSTAEIENGLSNLFSSWLSKIRLAR
jgi:Flp pilus assembly protein TadG